jgi:AcrR family transcriptional regulator
MRAEAAAIAIQLFLDQGFDDTTVDDLCAAMGLSRRSFFRYFKAKEGIVLVHLGDFAEQGCVSFSSRPGQEELWPALRHAMDPFARYATADPAPWRCCGSSTTAPPCAPLTSAASTGGEPASPPLSPNAAASTEPTFTPPSSRQQRWGLRRSHPAVGR